jgi:hypothetical protein
MASEEWCNTANEVLFYHSVRHAEPLQAWPLDQVQGFGRFHRTVISLRRDDVF